MTPFDHEKTDKGGKDKFFNQSSTEEDKNKYKDIPKHILETWQERNQREIELLNKKYNNLREQIENIEEDSNETDSLIQKRANKKKIEKLEAESQQVRPRLEQIEEQTEKIKGELEKRNADRGKNRNSNLGNNPGKDSANEDLYLERIAIESACYEEVLKPGAVIRIKAPWQMGKTSLMNRILQQAEKQGCMTVKLSFRMEDQKLFAKLDNFLRGFCDSVSKELNKLGLQLQLPSRLEDYWNDSFTSKNRCNNYFEQKLLTRIPNRLVLGLDDVDQIDKNPEVRKEFFEVLRQWHHEAKYREIWKKLSLVLAYSRHIDIPEIYTSPFNLGILVKLPEFKHDEVYELAKRYGLDWESNQVQQLMAMVGGYPYLVQEALKCISCKRITLEEFCKTAFKNSEIYEIYDEHLLTHLVNLQRDQNLETAMKKGSLVASMPN